MSTLRTPYPPIEPYRRGFLDVGEGNELYWEECGNPDGKPVVFVHGGPGGGCTAEHRRIFDPTAYRIVLFDQRNCGRSRPHVADGASLEHNTTWHLVADMERLREYLGITVWMLCGGSWGSTLSLAYAQQHPARVSEMVLRGIFLCRPSEIDWYYRGGAAHIFPEQWARYLAPLGPAARGTARHPLAPPGFDHVAHYYALLSSDDAEVALRAARAWTQWEENTSFLLPTDTPGAGGDEHADHDRFALAFARIENHYFYHDAFLADRPLLEGVDQLADIPAVLVHGRYDVVCPVATAVELADRWPRAELRISAASGHAMAEPETMHYLLEATDGFRPIRQVPSTR